MRPHQKVRINLDHKSNHEFGNNQVSKVYFFGGAINIWILHSLFYLFIHSVIHSNAKQLINSFMEFSICLAKHKIEIRNNKTNLRTRLDSEFQELSSWPNNTHTHSDLNTHRYTRKNIYVHAFTHSFTAREVPKSRQLLCLWLLWNFQLILLHSMGLFYKNTL